MNCAGLRLFLTKIAGCDRFCREEENDNRNSMVSPKRKTPRSLANCVGLRFCLIGWQIRLSGAIRAEIAAAYDLLERM